MSPRRALAVVMAGATLAACLGVVIIALAFALHALVQPWLGAAGATALVIALVAFVIAIGAVIAQVMLGPGRASAASIPATGLVDRALVFVRDRPVVSMVGAVGVGALVIANPLFIARLASVFLARRRADW
ncbi:MAG TPA: hypothetical protein VGH03_07580 [Caulobacteraceae bacterium]